MAASRPAILVITTRFPYPPVGGEKLRILSVIEHLSADFDVDVVPLYSDPDELAGMAGLRARCRSVHPIRLSRAARARNVATGWVRGWPLQVGLYYDRRVHREIDRIAAAGGHSAVIAHLVRTLEYTTRMPPGTVVLEMTDAIAMNYLRIGRPRTPMEAVYVAERGRLADYEAAAVGRVAHSVVVSATDRQFLLDRGAEGDIVVITNGTDVRAEPVTDYDTDTIAFLGNLRSAQNEDMCLYFAREILPRVRAVRPTARFLVIGANPSARVLGLQDDPAIQVTGQVERPDDLLARAAVSVCPMRYGAGVQNKILESMALGVPVVTTTSGWEGIHARRDREIVVADGAAGFAQAVAGLLADPDRRTAIGLAGREFVSAHFRWDHQMSQYRALLADCIARSGRTS